MTARRVAMGLAVVLGLLMLVVASRGVLLMRSGEPPAVLLGVAVVVLSMVGCWVLWRELSFGVQAQRLGARLDAEGGLPVDDVPRRPSGRADRDAADAAFVQRRTEVEAAPGDWRGWYRLGLAYDDAGDRKRARSAIRRAIAVARSGDAGA